MKIEFPGSILKAQSLILLLASIQFSSWSHAQSLIQKFTHKNDVFTSTEKVYPYLFDDTVKARINRWVAHPKANAYIVECQMKMRPFFKSKNIIAPLCYLLRQEDPKRRELGIDLARRSILELKSALIDISSDPRTSSSDKSTAKRYLEQVDSDRAKLAACFAPAMNFKYQDSEEFLASPFQAVASCLNSNYAKVDGKSILNLNLAKTFKNTPGHAVSDLGWLDGNKATYLAWNDTSQDIIEYIGEKILLTETKYPLTGKGSFESMMKADPKSVFLPAEGYPDAEDHKIWSQQKGIFHGIFQTVSNAQETLFIDIFFLGGTMGASLAKHIIKQVESKPNLKVFIIRDNINHFGHEGEMRPIYNYLLAYSHKNPSRLAIVSAHLSAHRSGLPKFMSTILSEEFIKVSGIQGHLSLNARATSDHSKVLVADGASANPIAIVSSKNLTDVSGAVCFDEAAKVEGPAAAAVLDDYYYDMVYALDRETDEAYVQKLASAGWAKSSFKSGSSKRAMIANILKPFDLLERNEQGQAQRTADLKINSPGKTLVRGGGNNVDSSRTNAVDQVVQLIKNAKKKILIKDQFLFDRHTVLALIDAKKANPNLDIRAILEPLEVANPKGMPNLLYLDILEKVGIDVKFANLAHNDKVPQEYHMKTISADGQVVITGSANKDQTTMYGAFREQQLEIFDEVATKVHDDVFEEHWRSNDRSVDFTKYDFPVPGNMVGPTGKPMTPTQFIALVRNVVAVMFDASVF